MAMARVTMAALAVGTIRLVIQDTDGGVSLGERVTADTLRVPGHRDGLLPLTESAAGLGTPKAKATPPSGDGGDQDRCLRRPCTRARAPTPRS